MVSPVPPIVFRCIAPAFVGGALFHAAAIRWPALAEPVPDWYHLMFVAVNLALAVLIVWRPRGFVYLFAAYLVQQYAEHLPRCLTVWREHGRFDLPGFLPLVFVPCVLALLIRDERARRVATPA